MANSGGGAPLAPTFQGFVHNSMDGLVLFEACLKGTLHHVPRRPHDRERSQLIKSGNVFIYEESASGIKRWTDGVAWSPSRILGNFLIYRELEKPFPPGEKKRAMKRKRASEPGEPYPRRSSNHADAGASAAAVALTAPLTPPTPHLTNGDAGGEAKDDPTANDPDKELERSLIGSLVDSYGFRPDGLVKKTMSVSLNGVSHHMVSYYKVDDVKNSLLARPMSDPRLANIAVRADLYLKQNFRTPVEESDHYAVDGNMHAHPHIMYGGMPYGMPRGQYMGPPAPYQSMYGVPASYGAASGQSWPVQSVSTGSLTYGGNSAYASYNNYYRQAAADPTGEQKADVQQSPSQQSMPYGGVYSPPYSTTAVAQRNGSIHSAYTTPVQQTTPTFGGQMGGGGVRTGRGSFSDAGSNRPVAPGGQPTSYNVAAQPYAVRSPAQSYGLQTAPASAGVPQSPLHHAPGGGGNSGVMSPQASSAAGAASTTPSQHALAASDANMSYRSGSYAVGGASQPPPPLSGPVAASPNVNGLGITTNAGGASYSAHSPPPQQQQQQQQQPQPTGHGYSYAAAPAPTYTPVADMSPAQTGHYGR